MERVTHTPAPWRTGGRYGDQSYLVVAGKATLIAEVIGAADSPGITWHVPPTPAEYEANRALIAAAPDLLRGCQLAAEMVSYLIHSSTRERAAEFAETQELLDQIIAKAVAS